MSKSDGLEKRIVANAKVSVGSASVEKVLAKIRLPKRFTKRPSLTLLPTVEQYEKLKYVQVFSVEASLTSPDGKVQLTISVDECWALRSEQKRWSADLSQCTIATDPRGVWVREPYGSGPVVESSVLSLWLSPNKQINPASINELDIRGNRLVTPVHSLTLKMGSLGLFVISKEHYWWSSVAAASATDSNLTAQGEVPYSPDSFADGYEEVLAKVDDYLLLVSLATRTRTTCFGWQIVNKMGSIKRYRPNVSIPDGYALPSLNDGLIDRSQLQDFLDSSFLTFECSTHRSAIRAAIYAIVPARSRVLESDFLSLFSSLEEILLSYRKQNELEHILSPSEWNSIRGKLKTTIKEAIPHDETARKRIYEKLSELNRIHLSEVFSHYVSELGAGLEDLWPAFDVSGGASLYQIRNWIAHGVRISEEAQDYLWIAVEHLRWMLERIVLTELDWEFSNSEISKRMLATHAVAMKDLAQARAKITDVMGIRPVGDLAPKQPN